MRRTMITFVVAALTLSACGGDDDSPEPAPAAEVVHPQDAFMAGLADMCGRAYAGVATLGSSDDFGDGLVMHVRSCEEREIQIPLHVGENRSRTWIITLVEGKGLRLKHDHRHEDGTSDEVTMYGGDTADMGNPERQQFPVDAESIALFERTGLTASVTNIWAVEVDDANYTYELSRKNRLFRVTFDLTRPVKTPPLPWGWDGP